MNSVGTETSANQKHLTSSGNYAGAVRRVQYLKANVIHRINRLTKKNLYGINRLREKHLERIQHRLMLKTQQTRNRGGLFQFHKHNLQKGLANIVLCSDVYVHHLSQHSTGRPNHCNKARKIKAKPMKEEEIKLFLISDGMT